MLQPLMALLAAASLHTAEVPPRLDPTETVSSASPLQETFDRAELSRLRAEREHLLQRLSEAESLPAPEERGTGGSGDEGMTAPVPTAEPLAPEPPRDAVGEELRALRQEVAQLRVSLQETEARLTPTAPPPAPAPVAEPVKPTPSEGEEGLELLRNSDTLAVQNASPLEKEVLGEVTVGNRTQEGDAGFVLQPQVRVGTPWKVEVGAGAQLQNLAGAEEGTTGAVSAYAVGQLVEEHSLRPQLALKGEVVGPQGQDGLSAEARLLATKHFGQTRLHGNAGYRVTQDAPDNYLVGLAADHPIGDRLLVQGDAYLTDSLGSEPASINASVGTGVRVGSAFVVTGAVGVHATAEESAPRLLFGVVGRI